MSDLVSFVRREEIGVISIDNPPVNVLGAEVVEGVLACLDEAERDSAVRAVILRGAGRAFIAGADIREFLRIVSGEMPKVVGMRAMIGRLEDFPKIVVAAIHGHALGGGLETAMACHYRVAAPNAQLGQPEVKLGLIPGAGGTQRLPRLVGVAKAAAMCAQGEPLAASEARRCGLVNAVAETDLLAECEDFTRHLLMIRAVPRPTRLLKEKLGAAHSNKVILSAARSKAAARWPGQSAPQKALDAIEAASALSFEEGLALEERLFFECLFSSEARALIRVFFGERKAASLDEASSGRLWAAVEAEARELAAGGVDGSLVNGALAAFGFSRQPLSERAALPSGEGAAAALRRCLSALINESARVLEENPQLRAIDVDVAAIRSCGFPSYRGGPLWFADETGLERILESIRGYHASLGARWAPAPLLESLVAAGKRFCEAA